MDYKKRYEELVKAIKQLQETNPSDEGIQNWANDTLYGTEETDDERIRKLCKELIESSFINELCNKEERDACINWMEKQGEQKPKKVSIWKHWKDGIAGGEEGKQIYLIKSGLTYSISSCLGQECDYIELSELDELLREEKQGKSKWNEDDEKMFNHIIGLLGGLPNLHNWLKSIKQRLKEQQ